MRKQPVMAATAVIALATGIGLAATGAAVLQATVFAELPFDGAERFVRLRAFAEPGGRRELDLDRYHRLAEHAGSFERIGAVGARRVHLTDPSGALEPERAALVTAGSFAAVPGVPLLGRTLAPADGEAGAPPVVLLRESLWRRRFEADPAVVGSTVEVAGAAQTVVGVMPDDYLFPAAAEIWLPLDDRGLGGSDGSPRPGLTVFAVLREGVTRASAQAEVDALVARPAAGAAAEPEVRVRLAPYTEPPEGWNLMISTLVGVLVLVLLVVAANVANLIAARTAARAPELAVRTALGASRARLVGQLTVEAALLGALAAVLGLAASSAALRWIDAQLGAEMPFWIDLSPGGATAAPVVVLALLATAVASVLPALSATRRDPAGRLRAATATGGVGRLGTAMVAVEMALSVALLSGALVMARGFALSAGDELALPRGEVLTARIGEPAGEPGAPPLRPAIVRAAASLPGVVAAGAASHLPRVDPPLRRTELAPEPGDPAAEAAAPAVPVAGVEGGYFEALGARPLAGRLLREADLAPDAPPVAVVNQPFVDRYLGGRNPIGRRLRLAAGGDGAPGPWREIVGVVPDLGLSVADPAMAAGWYLPLGHLPGETGGGWYLAVRSAGDPVALAGPLRRALAGLHPDLDVHRVVPLERVGWEDRAFMSGFGTALTAVGGMALLLSLAGIYAMLSFAVTRRRREIGVRVALGATGAQVVRSVVGGSALLLAAGAALGAPLALALMQARSMLVTRLPAGEPWILPAVLALLLAAGLAASWVPARRALAIRPGEALRAD